MEHALYPHVDNEALLNTASQCLLSYGAPWEPSVITSTEGLYVYTADGHRMLDWTSGQMSTLLGHGHPEVAEIVSSHFKHLDHVFSGMITPPAIKLGELLTSLLPPGLDKAMFLSTGGESNEAAIRIAKVATGKFEIVGLDASWHGMTGVANAAQYYKGRKGAGPVMPGNFLLPAPNAYRSIFRKKDGSHDWRTELEYGFSLVDKASCGSLAAVIMEPILSSGGILPVPPGYIKAMKEHCEQRGMLLIIDEAQTGIGRAGDMFAFQHYPEDEGVVPDILTLSKTLGNGLPLAAVVTSDAIAQQLSENGFFYYTTHMNDPLPCAVGLAVLEIVVRDGLVERARELGKMLQAGLRKLESRYGCIGDVRGRGLMAGLEIVGDRQTKQSNIPLGFAIAERMGRKGLWAQLASLKSFGGVFRMAPPITTSEAEVKTALAIMEEAFAEAEAEETLPLSGVLGRGSG